MENLLVDRLYKNISKELLKFGFSKEYIQGENLHGKIKEMIEKKDFTCGRVLNLCENIMNSLARENAPRKWLYYIYQFVLNKSFPKAVDIELNTGLDRPCRIYLKVLSIVLEFEKEILDPIYTIEFLTEKEEKEIESIHEYKKFKRAFEEDCIYEMMKLNKEVIGYNTLDHICGVHNLALFIGRQLKEMGVPVDLGRVSGSAAGHDIGKFGCRENERKRTPYLHYYYTDQWFETKHITYIRNIAVNHSTWDLELENLSLESLILIYCDFRVKKKNGKMHIFSLKESFDVILKKLDHVDEAKEKRYHRVYGKLKDFEEYMIHLGIHTDIEDENICIPLNMENIQYALMQGKEVIENIKYLSIQHNIKLMHKLRDESSLNAILESARSEEDANNLRGYLYVFEEYSTYMTQKQKMITLNFVYEYLMHAQEDIRKQCAEIMGLLIANFDESYRKEVPENADLKTFEVSSNILLDKYLQLLIDPDPQTIPVHRIYLGHSISNMIKSLFYHCSKNQADDYMSVLLKYYEKYYEDKEINIHLLETARYFPFNSSYEDTVNQLIEFIQKMLLCSNSDLRLYAFETIYYILKKFQHDSKIVYVFKNILTKNIQNNQSFAENYLLFKMSKYIDLDEKFIEKYKEDKQKISDMFLSNLKTSTRSVVKKVQIDFLLQYTMNHLEQTGLYTALHYCNILKVSASETVRNHAGKALLTIVPHIPFEQRNDVVIELLRGLEVEGYQFAKYIPDYLGKLILYLKPIELDELMKDLVEKIKQVNPQTNTLLLKTIGVATQNYHKYKDLFQEKEEKYHVRFVKMLGILQNGLVHYNNQVKQTAFRVIGKDVFGSKILTLEQKNHIFLLSAKKLLTLIGDEKEDNNLTFFTHAGGLNYIYRFISDYIFYKGAIELKVQEKVAFFPGTFDPFSLGHKEIAKEIRSHGFEVYLAVDEFSWSKKTQPHFMRRNIIKMSIADELGIYLYPQDIPVNISNPYDLKRLRESFPYSDVHIVVGSDVVLNASAYKKKTDEDSILSFSHVIFERKSTSFLKEEDIRIDEAIKKINNKVVRLSLPPQYEDISSTQIRNYIDQNRDISSLIDPIAQNFIYEKGLYRREPRYKTLVQTKSVSVEIHNQLTDTFLRELANLSFMKFDKAYEKLKSFSEKLNPRILLLRSVERNGEILGFATFHWLRSSMIFKEFQDESISEYVRRHAVGRILVIDGIFVNARTEFKNMEQMMLTETFAYALPKDYTYAVYKNMIEGFISKPMHDVLKCQGFEDISHRGNSVFAVNMTQPCTLYLNIESIIKEPFRSNKHVRKVIRSSRRKLQEAITKLYPGHLVLSFDWNMVYENLITKICEENGVSTIPTIPRKLGDSMCVPFGEILKGATIPNTVTKSMHTEKVFEPDVKKFHVTAYPYYLHLDDQVKMIRSFNRPVILVDDLLNKGYRIKVIDPIFKEENIHVKKIIVGILSGRGKELMDMQHREVDCAYFIPKLRVWFNESSLYPFIGGDTLWRGEDLKTNLVPSVNLILPYTVPTFIRNASKNTIYQLSQVCLENAMDIVVSLEEAYQKKHEKSLSLRHLGEVFISPRYPDHGKDVYYDMNLSPSHYLKNDLEYLKRLKSLMMD
ncbi:nicotinate-nicotinamide nucleotide adenylyltransferase [Crassaminicella profunda]|uniref:nicotinate-nicotinamide nucleotide adenylyltransferase n=1 Tax=Crassaminicella profunda TaxID=1286698 RepID=UPI001CA628D2|nr:adenylyltransferase/cytidyltransferase family protein [Crassaminicella profunda]QZY54867.1 adenylyltransferase/cytidyltransferase family protein [Crassaminicella profunda]